MTDRERQDYRASGVASGSDDVQTDRNGGDAENASDERTAEPNRGMRVGETKIGPLNDPND